MFLKKVHNSLKNVNKKILDIMKCGLQFTFLICIFATIILSIYLLVYPDYFLYFIGLNLFKFGIIIGIEFIICGLSVDAISSHGI